jgi:hypothetical protein
LVGVFFIIEFFAGVAFLAGGFFDNDALRAGGESCFRVRFVVAGVAAAVGLARLEGFMEAGVEAVVFRLGGIIDCFENYRGVWLLEKLGRVKRVAWETLRDDATRVSRGRREERNDIMPREDLANN